MFPSPLEIVLYFAYLAACASVGFVYAPYVVYVAIKRRRQLKTHSVRLVVCFLGLFGLYVWQQTRPSDTYTILEVISPSQKGSIIFLHEAAFQDPQTHLCVRDYSRSGNQIIHIGIVNIQDEIETRLEGATWSADGSNAIIETRSKANFGYDFRKHKIMSNTDIRALSVQQKAARKIVDLNGGYQPISYWELRGFRPGFDPSEIPQFRVEVSN